MLRYKVHVNSHGFGGVGLSRFVSLLKNKLIKLLSVLYNTCHCE